MCLWRKRWNQKGRVKCCQVCAGNEREDVLSWMARGCTGICVVPLTTKPIPKFSADFFVPVCCSTYAPFGTCIARSTSHYPVYIFTSCGNINKRYFTQSLDISTSFYIFTLCGNIKKYEVLFHLMFGYFNIFLLFYIV